MTCFMLPPSGPKLAEEKAQDDPGYEAVPSGDVARLKVELANIERRATALSAR